MASRVLSFFTLIFLFTPGWSVLPNEVLEKARLVNQRFMEEHPDPTLPTFVKKQRPSHLWTRAVYYEGLMSLCEIDPAKAYLDYALTWADFHQWTPRNGIHTTDADDQCAEQTFLMLDKFFHVENEAHVKPSLDNMRLQIATGKIDFWTWIDAIQMAMPAFAMAYQLTGEKPFINYAMRAYRWTRNKCDGGLFNANDGLWWRDADFNPPYQEFDGQPCYWSRGNGWVYAALVRVMQVIGPKHKYYKELRKDYLLMSQALKKYQREDGFWNVSLCSPTTFGGPESTGTALFLYGMSWGLENKLLREADYATACEKAWQALDGCVKNDGRIAYMQGTGKEPKDGQPVTETSLPDFDDYGTGCYLLGAMAYYKYLVGLKR